MSPGLDHERNYRQANAQHDNRREAVNAATLGSVVVIIAVIVV
jgi:hypothetical protein